LIRARHWLATTLVISLAALSSTVRSDDPVSSSVTFNREIARIFERKCLSCHAANAVAMPLGTYRDARLWARAIREEIVEQRMPPSGAASGYAPIKDDPGLNARQLAMILTWIDGGLPRGEQRDLPRAAAAHTDPAPDHLVPLPLQRVPANQEHIIRRVTVDSGVTTARRVQRLEIRPGQRRALRAAFVSIVGTRNGVRTTQWAGAWNPWQPAVSPPDGAAFLFAAGAKLEVELHYRGRDEPLEDRSSVALFYAPADTAAAAEEVSVDAVTTRAARAAGTATLRSESRVWAIVPRIPAAPAAGTHDLMEPSSDSLEVTARKPDGTVAVLLWVPRYRYDWPAPYVLKDPMMLPAGTTVSVTFSGARAAAGAPPGVTLATYR
jgi:hypothetical protein